LITATLPDPASFAPAGAFEVAGEAPAGVARLAAAFPSLSQAAVKKRLAAGGLPAAAATANAPEILYHLLAHPELAAQFVALAPTAKGAFAAAGDTFVVPEWAARLRADASPNLAAAIG